MQPVHDTLCRVVTLPGLILCVTFDSTGYMWRRRGQFENTTHRGHRGVFKLTLSGTVVANMRIAVCMIASRWLD